MAHLSPQSHLTSAERDQGLRLVLWDGIASQAMLTLSGGAFLVAFALQLGASNAQIGLLSAIPTLANIFQLFSVGLVRRYARRQIVVYACLFGRIMLFVIAAVPLFSLSSSVGVWVLLLSTVVLQVNAAVAGGSWMAWMHDLIPRERLGRFFSYRMRRSQTVGIVLGLACAVGIDYAEQTSADNSLNGYSVLFLLGGAAGLVSVGLLARTPEPKMLPNRRRFSEVLRQPFRSANFRALIIYNALWNFATNLAAPFFTVYLLQQLHYSVTYVIVLTTINQLTTVLALRFWGRYADRHGYKSILSICAPVYLLGILGWTFATFPGPHSLTLPLLVGLHILMGAASAGTSLSASSIGLKLAPAGEGAGYLAVISFTNALAAGAAPILGGTLADFFLRKQLALTLEWNSEQYQQVFRALDVQGWDFFFLLAFVLGMVALYRLAYVNEQGEVTDKTLVEEIVLDIQREMRSLSTITALRAAINVPVSFYRKLARRADR